MKQIAAAIFTILLSISASAQCISSDIPDPNCTPGVVASTDINEVCGTKNGQTYSALHRHTTTKMKQFVAREYGKTSCGEIDHRGELSLGFADDIKNLWCEPGPKETAWNFKLKDKLEAHIWRSVCKDHTIDLKTAQGIFLIPDWRVEYCKYIGGIPCKKSEEK